MEQELFERYLDGACSDAEAFQVEDWLNRADEAEHDAFFLKIWNSDMRSIPEDQVMILLNKLKVLTGLPKTRTIPMWKKFKRLKYYAAVCLLLLASAVLFRMNHLDKMSNLPEKREVPEGKGQTADRVYLYNREDTAKSIRLDDGTAIVLFRNSGLQYRQPFEKDRRVVYLTGKAVFSVAKDVKRPFTVVSNDISTTALGTKFLVHAGKDGSTVRIKLFSGKVLVSATKKLNNWQHDVFLLPGTQLQYKAEANVILSRFTLRKEAGNQISGDIENINKNQIRFNNALLPEVMKRLCMMYHIHIDYKASDIDRMNFTGVIDRSDRIESILGIIAKMNRLKIASVPKGFEVSRPAR